MRVVLGRSDELKSRSDIVDRGGNRGKRSDQALIIDGYEKKGCGKADEERDDVHIYRTGDFMLYRVSVDADLRDGLRIDIGL